MAVKWCFLLNRKNSSPGDAEADICCCKPALWHWPARQHPFLHLRLCERACPCLSWLWFYLILTVCRQQQEDSWHFQLSDGDHILAEIVLFEATSWEWCLCRESEGKVLSPLGPQPFLHAMCPMVWWQKLAPRRTSESGCLSPSRSDVEATNSRARILLLHGKYMVVPFKLEVPCKILWCITGAVQLPSRSD